MPTCKWGGTGSYKGFPPNFITASLSALISCEDKFLVLKSMAFPDP